jgi:hypothetical protein
MKQMRTAFSDADMKAFEPEMKIGLLATVNEAGLPHLTLISTLRASAPGELVWGQFTEGMSKVNIQRQPRASFLIMTLDKNMWRGKATWTRTARAGKDYDIYNNQPMFRYNAYFGVHTVYYMDLVGHTGKQPLAMGPIVWASVLTLVARGLGRGGRPVLNPWTRGLLDKIGNLKFLAYVGEGGYPVIVPVLQAQTADRERVIFSFGAYGDELAAVPLGAPVAVFGMALSMEDVLVRGVYTRRAGLGMVTVDWVYNPMPPAPRQVYPVPSLEPVTAF